MSNVIDPIARPPRAPDGLQLHGSKLWHAVVDVFDLRLDELVILDAAVRQRDEIARLESELKDAQTLVRGSMGQQKPNPIFAELRQHRLSLAKLLTQLGLEDDEAAASVAGRKLARTRWSHGAGKKRSA